MSDATYVGKRLKSFNSSNQFDGYTRVVIVVTDDTEYVAGVDTGRTLTLRCPWGTPEMASNILASVGGFQYQPYIATGTQLDPATELGDAITVHSVYSGVYKQVVHYGRLSTTSIEAPTEEIIDHEYPYVSKNERSVSRSLHNLLAELKVQSNMISAEVSERKNDVANLEGKLQVQSNKITAEVSNRESAVNELKSLVNIEKDRITAEVKARTNEDEYIKNQLKVQSDQITAEVNARKSDYSTLNSTLGIQAKQIEAKVSQTGGSSSTFGWTLNSSSWTIQANSTNILKATSSGLEVYGKVTATSGKIGGFTINSNYLSYNNQTWGGTNSTGIYVGPSGFQLGKYFKVDSSGNLTAASGTFTGSINAGNIRYGDSYGHLNGAGLVDYSIYTNKVAYNTLSISRLDSGVTNSLGHADYAYNVCTGVKTADTIVCYNLRASTRVSAGSLYIGGYSVARKSKSFKDGNGTTQYIYYWGWS